MAAGHKQRSAWVAPRSSDRLSRYHIAIPSAARIDSWRCSKQGVDGASRIFYEAPPSVFGCVAFFVLDVAHRITF